MAKSLRKSRQARVRMAVARKLNTNNKVKKTKRRLRSVGWNLVKKNGYGKKTNTRYVRKVKKGVYLYKLKNR